MESKQNNNFLAAVSAVAQFIEAADGERQQEEQPYKETRALSALKQVQIYEEEQ